MERKVYDPKFNNIIMVPLSGGLDSTYLFYDLVKRRPNNVRVVPFHVIIENDHEEKCDYELTSILNIHNQMKSVMPWTPNILFAKYVHEGFGFGRDTEPIFMTAQKLAYKLVLESNSDSDRIILIEGVVMDDLDVFEFDQRHKALIDHKLWKTLVATMEFRIPESDTDKICYHLKRPLIECNVFKKDIILDMPSYIMEHIWYCRTPDGPDPCGVCQSCRIHATALVAARAENPNLKF